MIHFLALQERTRTLVGLERYDGIVKYKTAYYTFCLPTRCAMYLAGINDPTVHAEVEKPLLKIGHYFQVQDDYLDCYGDPNVIGKIGTDIQDGKCSWLIVMALEHASKKQLKTLKENYNIDKQESIDKVKRVYKELNMEGMYHKYEDCVYKEILEYIEKITKLSVVPGEVFYSKLNKIYKRSK